MTAFNVQDSVLSGIRAGQEAVVGAVKTCVETVQAIAPKLPVPNVPFADRLPRPEGVVARAYEFAETLLASQRTFAEELLAVLPGGARHASGAEGASDVNDAAA
ncbi:MAG TPA: hypothetical protein VFB06_02420 [Streptosporangiaceae bacterium]|nr:hypothetical protein [Streptosporangiaceae bacterium]